MLRLATVFNSFELLIGIDPVVVCQIVVNHVGIEEAGQDTCCRRQP